MAEKLLFPRGEMTVLPTPTASSSAGDQKGHLPWIDWLRFLAAAVVLLGHVHTLNWKGGPVERLSTMGVFLALGQLANLAVVVFFVISGLLVGGKTLQRIRAGNFDAASYAADRLSRVYVPLLPALLLTAAVVRAYDLPLRIRPYLASLLSLQGIWFEPPTFDLPLWSLSYEVWFYVLAGCVAVLVQANRTTWQRIFAGAGIILSLAMFVRLEIVYLGCWLFGAAGFWLRARITRGHVWVALTGLFIAVLGAAVYEIDHGYVLPPTRAALRYLPSSAMAQLLVAGGTVLLVASVIQLPPSSRLGKQLDHAGTPLAAFSYTLYLTHFPVLCALALSFGQMPLVVTPLSVARAIGFAAICMGVAFGMYILFEARTHLVRRQLRRWLDGSPPAASSPGLLAAQSVP